MTWLLIVIFILMLAMALPYAFFPARLIEFGRGLLRKRGGMTLKHVRAGGIDWPYLEGGGSNGKAVVLVHGFGADKDSWSFYAPYLSGHYRLICPDLPGFGENDRSMAHDHSVAAQAARLKEFLDALGIDKCHMGGNSMGGFIALRFALDFPERLYSLTLFNNAGVIGTEESELQKMVLAGDSNPLAVRTMADIDRMMAFVVHKPRWVPGQFKRVVFGQIKPHEELLDKIFAQIAEDALSNPLNDHLHRVETPTQIIWGRHDKLIDVTCAMVQHDGIANSELVIFEDAGHVPMIEKPAETAKHHLSFLAKH